MEGKLYSGQELRRLLKSGDVFDPRSVQDDSIRSAGYDLHLAHDMIIVVCASSSTEGKNVQTFDAGESCGSELVLDPGDTALVSTVERPQFKWDVTATIGAKFDQSVKGLFVLTGMVIDPGYGRVFDQNDWIPRSPRERIYFWLVNISLKAINLRPGVDRIARIQFFSCEEPSVKKSPGTSYSDYFDDTKRELERRGEPGLALFAQSERLSTRMQALETDHNAIKRDVAQLRSDLDLKTDTMASTIDSKTETINLVLVLGIFLIVSAILGAAFTESFDAFAGLPKNPSSWDVAILAIGLSLLFVVDLIAACFGVRYMYRMSSDRRQP